MAAPADLPRDAPIARDDGVLAERVLEDTVLLDPATGSYVRLNAAGSVLWEGLERPSSIAELAGRLVERYALDAERASADAERFVASLAERGLVRVGRA